MLQSALTASILHHIRSQLFYVTLSLMRNFGLIGGTSRALGALSAAVSKLATGSTRYRPLLHLFPAQPMSRCPAC
jgi:hypothetical protein